jgi:hypothetical protein
MMHDALDLMLKTAAIVFGAGMSFIAIVFVTLIIIGRIAKLVNPEQKREIF